MPRVPQDWKLARPAELLLAGGVIAYPTEGVFGLGCQPRHLDAVARILAIKQRAANKGLILIAAFPEQLIELIDRHQLRALAQADAAMPAPTTFIVPARTGTPALISGGRPTLAVRLTRHPQAARLCELTGSALISTSANLAGREALTDPASVMRRFGDRLDHVIHAACGGLKGPTEIRDLTTGRVLRAGAG